MSYDYDEYHEPETDREVTLEAAISIQWSNDDVIERVVDKLADRIYGDIKPKVETSVLAALDDQVNAALAATLDTEIQPTDRWGKPTGDKVSIRAMLQQDAETWLTANVDYKGRTGSEAYGDKHPRVHWIIEEALGNKKDNRRKTRLQEMVVQAAKATIGNVTEVVETEVRAQAKKALGI